MTDRDRASAGQDTISPAEGERFDPFRVGSIDQLIALGSDPTQLKIVSMLQRPGTQAFMEETENTHYTPGTERNALFNLNLLNWEGLVWCIIAVPIGDRALVEAILPRHGLRMVLGTPYMIGGGKAATFPMDGKDVFSLENTAAHYEARNKAKRDEA